MSATTPWRFAGCRDVVDMLEQLPTELDNVIMRRAGALARFRLNRLPQPLSLETVILLWCECVMDDDVDALPSLPVLKDSVPGFVFLARSGAMVEALGQAGFEVKYARSDVGPHHVSVLVSRCPDVARQLLPYFEREFPERHSKHRQSGLLAVAAAAAGDLVRLEALLDVSPNKKRSAEFLHTVACCISAASLVGHRHVARRLMADFPAKASILDAIDSGDREFFEEALSRLPPKDIRDYDVVLALERCNNEFARQIIEHRKSSPDYKADNVIGMCIRHGNVEVLRAIATSNALRSARIGQEIVEAAEYGYLDILKAVFDAKGSVPNKPAVLGAAVKGGWVDSVHWLVNLPAKATKSKAATAAAAAAAAPQGPTTMLDVLLKAPADARTPDIADSFAEQGNLAMLNQLLDHGFTCMDKAVGLAAENGHLAVVEALYARGIKCTPNAMDRAVRNGHLAVVEALHARGVGCSPDAIRWAVLNNHLDVIKFLFSHGSDCTHHAIESLQYCKNSELSRFVLDNCSDEVFVKSLRSITEFKWSEIAKMSHADIDPAACDCRLLLRDRVAQAAGEGGDLEMAKLLAKHLQEPQWTVMSEAARASKRAKLLAWIESSRSFVV
ncbi:hypothetical protein HK105_206858 [Polyrhizophydium stewartii]|uniref:Ankyrin repeat protein n=1 Tax=Polyrhizophydium stewartii TaxID=2732419 RepID=A0ABR4N2L1_9FUNG